MAFEGSCRCGKVVFTVDADLPVSALSCNCSICRRKGLRLAFFPPERFTVTRGEGDLATCRLKTHRIAHRFCTACGTRPFAFGVGPDGRPMRAINPRCVPAVDLDALELQRFDDAALS